MLTLAVTFLVALYLLGPDLVSRWIIGFVAPRRSVPVNRGEQITRAVLWAAIPLLAASLWVWKRGVMGQWGHWSAVDNVYACLSSTCTGADRTNLSGSLRGFVGMNFSLLWREYLLVVLGALAFTQLIVHFAALRRMGKSMWYREGLASLVTSQLVDWHVWLSGMLLPEDGLTLVADVLTRSGTLYQGTVGKRTLGADGSLQTLTLTMPRRFLRDDFHAAALEAEKAGKTADREAFWREIPGNIFILMGSDITNLNILYVRAQTQPPTGALSAADRDQIRRIMHQIMMDNEP